MTIRSSSKRTKKVDGEKKKRQPFGLIEDGQSRKAVDSKRKKERRKSRQIGDHVLLFIQERNSKAKTLYRAKVDSKTGGITYTPANRKTPIAYDRHRHNLIEKTPDGDQIELELELDCDEEKENIDSSQKPKATDKFATKQGVAKRKIVSSTGHCGKRRSVHPARSYAESTDTDSSSSSESDCDDAASEFEAPQKRPKADMGKVNQNPISSKSSKVRRVQVKESDEDELPPTKKVRRSRTLNKPKSKVGSKMMSTTATASKKKQANQSKGLGNEDVNNDDPLSDVSATQSTHELPSKFSSPKTESNWKEQPDWRCAGAMDY